MTQPNEPHATINDPSLSIPGFDDLALHLSQEQPPKVSRAMTSNNETLPVFLERTPPVLPARTQRPVAAMTNHEVASSSVVRVGGTVARTDVASAVPPAPHSVAVKVQQLRAASEQVARQMTLEPSVEC